MTESDKRLEELEKKTEEVLNALLEGIASNGVIDAWGVEQRNDIIRTLGELLERINTMRCMQNFKEARSQCRC